jgi:hypothetical protein
MDERKKRKGTRPTCGVYSAVHARHGIATGFDFEPLPDGNVLIEFFGDDGKTFSTQVVTPNVVESMPLVATLTGVAMREGADAVKEILAKLNECQDEEVSDDR